MLAVLSTMVEVDGNPLLEHQGRWTLVSHRRDTGKHKGSETRIGLEPQDLATHMSQNREGWKADGRFGGKALLSDSLSVIAFHWGVSTEIYILQGEIEPGNSTLAFLTGTRWDPGQTFRAVAKLNRDAPYDQILLPDESKQQREIWEKGRQREEALVPIYDLMELRIIGPLPGYGDRTETFRFRRTTN